jgi:hypothetical protein
MGAAGSSLKAQGRHLKPQAPPGVGPIGGPVEALADQREGGTIAGPMGDFHGGAAPRIDGVVRVAQDGSGHFRSVQAAIDALPLPNTKRVVIRVAPGVYRQPIYIPKRKNLITLQVRLSPLPLPLHPPLQGNSNP